MCKMISTHIDANDPFLTAKIRFDNGVGEMEFSFQVLRKLTMSSFKFEIFEHYMYMYKGKYKAFDEKSVCGPPSIYLTPDANMLCLSSRSSAGNVEIKIPYDDMLKKFVYECACGYLYHFVEISPWVVPKLYLDTVEADKEIFEQKPSQ